ncbi:MAG: pentapeptide repeat-containing protein [Planctomycetota bacterium]
MHGRSRLLGLGSGLTFERCDLRGADFAGADVAGADFRSAKLEGANFRGATYDARTRFPSAFDPDSHGMFRVPPPPWVPR